MKGSNWFIILSVVFGASGWNARAQSANTAKQTRTGTKTEVATGVQELYQEADGGLLWYCNSCEAKRVALLNYISHSDTVGLEPTRYLTSGIKQYLRPPESDAASLQKADRELSKIALRFSGDLYAGAEIDQLVSFDEVSSQYAEADKAFLVRSWNGVSGPSDLTAMLNSLQPQTQRYRAMKQALQRLPSDEREKRLALIMSMNYYRWINHFALDSYIVVNIPATSLRFFRDESVTLQMRTVVGTSDSRTPRMASHIKDISLYPYWNVPRNLLMDEWFDLIKDNRAVLDYHEMEIVDNKGTVVPYEQVKWKSMSSKNFPYRIRQKTGCSNPLGVVKFGMNNPFDVYLHDTPGKGAFDGQQRYYSHGCVRVEDAIGLANAILPGKVDARYLNACFSDQQPQVLAVPNAVPVFIVYMLADVDGNGAVSYYKDIYGLMGEIISTLCIAKPYSKECCPYELWLNISPYYLTKKELRKGLSSFRIDKGYITVTQRLDFSKSIVRL